MKKIKISRVEQARVPQVEQTRVRFAHKLNIVIKNTQMEKNKIFINNICRLK